MTETIVSQNARYSPLVTARPDARTRLLAAADELFAAEGFTGTPVDAVLRRAEVAPATLYAHFGTKAGLLEAVLTDRLAAWDATWARAVSAARDDRARLLAVFDAVEAFRAGATPARWCAFLDAAAGTPTGDPTAEVALAQDTALLRRRLTELAGPVAGDRAAELGEHLVLVVTGMLAMQLREDADDARRQGRRTAELLVDAAAPAVPSRRVSTSSRPG